jgi:Raf kinase inhibitor-like YbhB/YbcL family protein
MSAANDHSPSLSPSAAPLELTSRAFAANGPIPAAYTCRGADRSPDLAWSGIPTGSTALVLFVDDPDGRDWVHWSVLDIDPSTTGLPAGVEPTADPPQQGTNDFGRVGYGGPCPPSGTHHYQFTLYALAAPLGLGRHPDGDAVRAALETAQVLSKVTLVGTFSN